MRTLTPPQASGNSLIKVLQEENEMSKSRDTKKEPKKKPQKSTKEKRQEKRAKKNDTVV